MRHATIPYCADHERRRSDDHSELERESIMFTLFRTAAASICLLAATSVVHADQSGATYELRRINHSDGSEYESRCHFTPGTLKHITQINGVQAEQEIPVAADDALIQSLVEQAPGLTPPSF